MDLTQMKELAVRFQNEKQALVDLLDSTKFADHYGNVYGGKAYGYDFHEFNEDGVEIVGEYNDSCNCHPEYRNEYFTIPWEHIEVLKVNREEAFGLATIAGEAFCKAQDLYKQALLAKKQKEDTDRTEAYLRAQYESLRARFEPPQNS